MRQAIYAVRQQPRRAAGTTLITRQKPKVNGHKVESGEKRASDHESHNEMNRAATPTWRSDDAHACRQQRLRCA